MGVTVKQAAPGLPERVGFFQLVEHGVQDSVDELSAVLRAEGLGDLDRLVDGDLGGNVGKIKKLADAHLQKELVDDRDPVVLPVSDLCLDEAFDFRLVADDFLDQPFCKLKALLVRVKVSENVFQDARDGLLRELVGIQRLKNPFAGRTSSQ